MKVLLIHNFHRTNSSSGDDIVFNNEKDLLNKHGYEIKEYTRNNDEFDKANIIKKIVMIFGMFFSLKSYFDTKKIIKSFNPDIVHVHNFFPLVSPSVLLAAKKSNCKVVVTLHDTRLVCPCATSLCKNKICNKCIDGKYLRMIRYNCFKNSKLMSVIVAMIFNFYRKTKIFYNTIDKFICLNDTQIDLLKKCGFDENKIEKKYNFINSDLTVSPLNEIDDINLPGRYVLFYGRLGEEKGIRWLFEIWENINDIPLVIMGSGPLCNEVKKWALRKKNIYFIGYKNHFDCYKILKKSEFVIFPSIWYEGCSMVVLETFALNKTIIASDIGFTKEVIKNGINGFKIPLKDTNLFKEKIIKLWNDKKLLNNMSKNSLDYYNLKFTKENSYNKLKEIYNNLIETKKILYLRCAPYKINNDFYNLQEVGLAKGLHNCLGYKVDIIYYNDVNLIKRIDDNIRIIYMKGIKILRTGIYPTILLKKIYNDYDIVISSECNQLMSYILSKKKNNFYIYHGPYYNMFKIPFLEKIYYLMFAKSLNSVKKIFTKTNFSNEYLKKYGITNVITTGVGLDVDKFKNSNLDSSTNEVLKVLKKRKNILYVGSIIDRKNLIFIIRTFINYLENYNINVNLVIVGDGKKVYKNKCLNIIPEKYSKNFVWISKLKNAQLKYIYQNVDMFICASKKEIFGMALLEAMYFKVPVLSNKNAGACTLIKNKYNGFILDSYDVDVWSYKIDMILSNDNMCKKIGENANKTITNYYNWDTIANKMTKCFNNEVKDEQK